MNMESTSAPTESALLQESQEILRKIWGYNSFRPLQQEAIECVLEKRDSLVVLPTGGGKSLCYQVPAMQREGLTVVVSPLISLMKDQVDALVDLGISAAAVNSSQSAEEQREIANRIRSNQLKMLYVAPERLCTERMLKFLSEQDIAFFAIDEAHCISSWGHQFRPEYRLLGTLREHFPTVDFHAYTATATEQVRSDIAKQLSLNSPSMLVGNFDRPNLIYRLSPRNGLQKQIGEILERFDGQSGIIYCISRKQVDQLTRDLKAAGYRAGAYHAGLENREREQTQNDFLNEKVSVVVATVAFGMGINKPNVRFVIHAAASKSIENYQQETGRAGRDQLPAECHLFYGGKDFEMWKMLNSELTGEAARVAENQIRLKRNFCHSLVCRRKTLVEHFGQQYEETNCSACDVCLEEIGRIADDLVVSQKILSCVVRVEQRFGADYVASVLTGSKDQRILENQHHQLSTYGLLKTHSKKEIRSWIDQLIAQECLRRDEQYGSLLLASQARKVLRNEHHPTLLEFRGEKSDKTREAKKTSSKLRRHDLSESELKLFDDLRQLRREIAQEKEIAPFIVFGDVTLIDLSSRRPTTLENFLQIQGVGTHKGAEYGERFLNLIRECSAFYSLTVDVGFRTSESLKS